MKSCKSCKHWKPHEDRCVECYGFDKYEPKSEEPMVTVEVKTMDVFVTTDGTKFFDHDKAFDHQAELAVSAWVEKYLAIPECYNYEVTRTVIDVKDELIEAIQTGKMP